MEIAAEYGLFLAKTATLVLALGIVLSMFAGMSRRSGAKPGLKIEKLNDSLLKMKQALQRSVMSKSDWKKQVKQDKKEKKKQEKAGARKDNGRHRMYVLDFKGDIRATGVAHLREEITAILSVATPEDEVVLRLENHGGTVHEHGLAASQLLRVKEKGVPLTVIIDKVAASGGYLMACIANRLIAAPFSVIGSIGVIAQIPNFNRALAERGVDFEQITAGKYKRTVTMFGKTSDEDREKLREELEDVHALFKSMVAEQRPSLDIDSVATGEHWYGRKALEMGLVDEIGSSDDYLMKAAESADIYTVSWRGRQKLQERLFAAMETSVARLAERAAEAFSRVSR